MRKKILYSVSTLLLIIVFVTPLLNAVTGVDAPFSINVEPKSLSAKAGDEVTYTLRIEAEEGYDGVIAFVLDVSALGYSTTLDLGTQFPPYPKDFEYSYTIPSEIPEGVTIEGVLTATDNMGYVQQENVEISIQSTGPGGDILSWFLKALSDIWNAILSLFGQ